MSEVVDINTARQERDVTDEPDLEQGYIKIVNALAEGLAQSSLTSRQFRVVWAVIRKTYGFNKSRDRIAASQIAEVTGLRRQRCSEALCDLETMGVIIREGGSFGSIKINTKVEQWSVNSNEHEAPKPGPSEGSEDDPKMGSLTLDDQNGVTDPKMGSNYDPKMGSHKIQNTKPSCGGRNSRSESPGHQRPEKPAKKRKPKADHQGMVDAYNEILGDDLPSVQKITDTRRKMMNARWNDTYGKSSGADLEFWRRYFRFVRKSAMLCGMKPGQIWAGANFDWLLKESNMAKVIEGNYHGPDDLRTDLSDDEVES